MNESQPTPAQPMQKLKKFSSALSLFTIILMGFFIIVYVIFFTLVQDINSNNQVTTNINTIQTNVNDSKNKVATSVNTINSLLKNIDTNTTITQLYDISTSVYNECNKIANSYPENATQLHDNYIDSAFNSINADCLSLINSVNDYEYFQHFSTPIDGNFNASEVASINSDKTNLNDSLKLLNDQSTVNIYVPSKVGTDIALILYLISYSLIMISLVLSASRKNKETK